ncbi:DNA polymerase III subunit alpha, partial [Candidatus Roizmanbacteria bacterium CG09_land_8_20_14_0_10_41_9]
RYHIVLLVKNETGYKNLVKLLTRSHLEGFYYKPRIDEELLSQYSEGLICFSACLQGKIPRLILAKRIEEAEKTAQKYQEIFGRDNFYLELQHHPNLPEQKIVNEVLVAISKKFKIPLVATNDCHYLRPEDAQAQDILMLINTGADPNDPERLTMKADDFSMRPPEKMIEDFKEIPEAIENTQKIATLCNFRFELGKTKLPRFETPNGKTPDEYLKELCYQGLERRFGKNVEKGVIDRLEYELSVIKQTGFASYFLIVQDFVNWAKQNRIVVGPGRGSVGGSLVAYLLNITNVDPMKYNLLFERFLNPSRVSLPDIDLDFADRRRDEVIEYVRKKYGQDKVAQIITFGTMEARLAVRDVARALGMSYSEGDRLAKMIPQGKQGFPMSLSRALEESLPLKLAYQSEPESKKVIDIARRVEGMPRHASVHAAGVVIADKDLTDYVPLQRESKEGRIITQYDMYCLDLNAVSNNKAIGLLKVDFLGLRNLTILEEAIRYVEKSTHNLIDIHDISLDDKKAYELISKGQTVGIFQLESSGMRRLAKDLEPSKLSEITAMVALFRPGPMDLIPEYVEGKRNPKKVRYLHPDLKNVLEETYGILVYQEQVMEIAHQLAGFSMSEADLLRMAMGKKKKSLMEEGKRKFIEGCVKKGYKRKLAEDIFKFIEKFAAYGFNKPHAASYALIAYWTAYMKSHYPVEFMTALLSAELQGVAGTLREIKMAQAIEECRRMEIAVLPPDINKSQYSFAIEQGSIRFGLSAIKNVGHAAIDSILDARKSGIFKGFKDFLFRVDLRKVNKKTVESLIKAGAYEKMANKATLLTNYPIVVREISQLKLDQEKGQFALFSQDHSVKDLKDQFEEIPELGEEEIYHMEREIIGFLITQNPLNKYKSIIDRKVTKKIGEIVQTDVDKTFIFAGIISGKKIIKTKRDNSEMAFIQIFDETGTIEGIVFPRTFQKLQGILVINKVILLKGKINSKDGKLSIIFDNAINLETVKTP